MTDAATWSDWLEGLPAWTPPALPTVVVAAHPDDESLGAGGLIAHQARARVPVTLVAATDGDAAYDDAPGLAAIRRDEQVEAFRALGGGVIHRLGLPDGGLARHEAAVTEALLPRLERGTLVVAPFEHDGHPDHDACGRAALRAAGVVGARVVRYPVWLWHWSAPRVLAGRRVGRLDLTPTERAAKDQAVAAHRSQHAWDGADPILGADVLVHFERDAEAFVLPDDGPGPTAW